MKHSNSRDKVSRVIIKVSRVIVIKVGIWHNFQRSLILMALLMCLLLVLFLYFLSDNADNDLLPLNKIAAPLDIFYSSNIPNPAGGTNFMDPMDPSFDSILASIKIDEERLAAIRREEKILALYGAKNGEIQDIILDVRKTKLKERLNQHPDLHESIFYLLFPKKTIKWKTYQLIGSLHQILENRLNESKAIKPKKGLEGYVLRTKKNFLVPNLVRLKLSGSRFEIRQISEEWQSLESIYACEWLWEIIPNERDKKAELYFALEGKNNAGQVFSLTTFTETVSISGGYGKDLAKNWQWIGLYVITPVTVWLAGAGRWKIVWAYLKGLFKRTKVVKVEEVKKEEPKEGKSGK